VWLGVALIIQTFIDASDERNKLTTLPDNTQDKPTDFGNVHFGSPQKSTSIEDPAGLSTPVPLLTNFHTKLSNFLKDSGYGIAPNNWVQ